MRTRYDISQVPLQSAYIAKRCPVRIQNDILEPSEPLEVSEEAALRMQRGIEFEAEVFADLRGLAPSDWVFIDDRVDRDEQVRATVAALGNGAELIAGGWLPIDDAGRRVGKPDLLIRSGGGYVPVDVKHHLTLDVVRGTKAPAKVSSLRRPLPIDAAPKDGWMRRKRREDALQLAHYRRMLEALGLAADSMHAGIIGSEKLVVWYDLDEPLWQTPAKSDGKRRKTRTTMEVYDFEFSFRLDIAAVAQSHLEDPTVRPLVEPMRCSECADCSWRESCGPILEAGSGDASLLPGINYRAWRALRDVGIHDRAGVAALHWPTAKLAADGVKFNSLYEKSSGQSVEIPLRTLIPRAKKQLRLLDERGISSVGDLRAEVDATTAKLDGAYLPKVILRARAAIGVKAVYRWPGKSGDTIPRGDLEIDVDMENTQDGTYLWGAWVSDPGGTGLTTTGYRPFVTWEPVGLTAEMTVFREFWAWLRGLLVVAEEDSASVRVYCWHEAAENTQMRRLAAADPALADEVETFIASEVWVDLERVFKTSWLTGGSTGLKSIASLAGYEWPVDDPGGDKSLIRHAEATEGSVDRAAAAQAWLLDYNRGDVEATLFIREWLAAKGASWPEVEVD